MKLGDFVQIVIGIPDLSESHGFYNDLGFQTMAQGGEPWPWAQLSDGQNLVLLNQDSHQYVGLNYFSTSVSERIAQLEGMGVPFVAKMEVAGRISQAIFRDPNGCMVGLINQDASQIAKPPGAPWTDCGRFGEFAIPVQDFRASAAFWGQLGFDKLQESQEPYPWGIFDDGLIVIGLHQTDSYGNHSAGSYAFNKPTMTFFAPDMGERIAQLKDRGCAFAVELKNAAGSVNAAILQTPGGEPLFLVQGEVLEES